MSGLAANELVLAFIAAEAREFTGLLAFCKRVGKVKGPVAWARSAELNGRDVLLIANGAGPRLAAVAADFARSKGTEAVVSTGFCGGLDPALKVGDVFVATNIKVNEEQIPALEPRSTRPYTRGTLLSIDRVAQTPEEKRDLRRLGASAVEMEAAGVLSRVREWGVPFYCIRSVTDLAGESFQMDFNAVRRGDGSFSTPRILAAAMARPATLAPELFELKHRCAIAAQSLGEFIADCSF